MKRSFLVVVVLVGGLAADAFGCSGPPAYVGCSSDQLRQIQAQQFRYRNSGSVTQTQEYWRDRQYMDRIRAEQRTEDRWHARLESETRREVARQQRRSWRSYYRPRTVYVSPEWNNRYPQPEQPIAPAPTPEPEPVVRRMVPSALP